MILIQSLLLLTLSLPATAAPTAASVPRQEEAAEEWVSQAPEFRIIEQELLRGKNDFFGDGQRRKLEHILEQDKARPAKVLLYSVSLARSFLKAGEIDEAVKRLEAIGLDRPDPWSHEVEFLYALGGAYMRQAETENCVSRHNDGCCLFPLEGDALHSEKGPAQKALATFLALLDKAPDNLEVRWLANLAAMALDEWPASVPEPLRIPFSSMADEAVASSSAKLGMRNVASALGVDAFDLCGGVALEDFDGDGFIDILSSSFDPSQGMSYFRNRGDGTFADLSDASHASDQFGGLNIVAADYDGDGDRDVFVLRGAWLQDAGQIRNSLLRNDGGVFVDVTRAAGLAEPACPTQTAVFGDFDQDGDLDLFVANESRTESLPPREPAPENETPKEARKRIRREKEDRKGEYPAQLFLNQGDGTFIDGAVEAGATADRYCKGVSAGDYDNDGDLDLYLSNIGRNQLLRNDGKGHFEDVAELAGVMEPVGRSFATWFFDYDNDGWLDIFVAAYDATLADLAAEALGQASPAPAPRLYRNQRDGTFLDVAAELGLARPLKPMGANFGDLDGDGWLDLYLTTGEPQLMSLMPNVLLRNDAGQRFVDQTVERRLGHLQKGHGVGFADLDHDGDADIYNQLGGFFPVDRYYNALFENPGHGSHWLYLELVGTGALRDPIGARVKIVVETPAGPREIHRAHGTVSSFGGSPARMEVGLGDAQRITRVEVIWPGSKSAEVYEGLELDSLVRLRKGVQAFERIPIEAFEFAVE